MINQRIFSANVGDISTGQAGPDAIEQDIDNLLANDQELLGTINDHGTQINNLDAYAVASGTNIYTATINGYALQEGKSVKIKFTNANTGASTLNINGLGAKAIQKGNGSALSSGNIKAGQICNLVYTGSVFQLLGEGGEYGTAIASDVLSGKTIGTESGIVSGSMVDRGTVNQTITTQGGTYTIAQGYHSGTGKVTASFGNLSAGNVKGGVNIGGVVGTFALPERTHNVQTYTADATRSSSHELTQKQIDGYPNAMVSVTVVVGSSKYVNIYQSLNGATFTQLVTTTLPSSVTITPYTSTSSNQYYANISVMVNKYACTIYVIGHRY